jgi:hypothetical protein
MRTLSLGNVLSIVATFGLCAPTPSAIADEFDRHVASIVLLQSRKVQAEVGITPAQRKQLNVHADWHRAQLQSYEAELKRLGAAGKPADPDERRLASLMGQLKVRVLKELTDAQTKRLREISLQVEGISALLDPVVAARVGLTAKQNKQLQSIFADAAKRGTALQQEALDSAVKPFKASQPKNEREANDLERKINQAIAAAEKRIEPQLQRIRAETHALALKTLTTQQVAVWKRLQGKPFVPPK